jgi:phage tail-like protein
MTRLHRAEALDDRRVRVWFEDAVRPGDVLSVAFRALTVPAVALRAVAIQEAGVACDVEVDVPMSPRARYEVCIRLPSGEHAARFEAHRGSVPNERSFELRDMVPAYNRRADASGDLRRLLACFQDLVDLLQARIDRMPDTFSIERAPPSGLDELLRRLGNHFDFEMTDREKRRLAATLVAMYGQRGTAKGIEDSLRLFLGAEGTRVLANRLSLPGQPDGGHTSSSADATYSFDVIFRRTLSPRERFLARQVIEYLQPVNCFLARIVEPSTLPSENGGIGERTIG